MHLRTARVAVGCVLGLALTLGVASFADEARADAPVSRAIAEGLFQEGKKLLDAGEFNKACAKLEESQRLEPSVGTALYLGFCYDKAGKTASAWASYRAAESTARATRQHDREKIAREKATALEPKLCYLTVTVPEAMKGVGLELRRDGEPLGEAVWNTAMPTDPGPHIVVASAPGKHKWSSEVVVQGDGSRVFVAVPTLEKEPDAHPVGAASTTPAVVTSTAPVAFGPHEPAAPSHGDSSRGNVQRWASVLVGAVGIGAVGFGIWQWSRTNTYHEKARDACPSATSCDDTARLEYNTNAKSATTLQYVGYVTGGVLLAGGVALYLTAPTGPSKTTAVRVVPALGANCGGAMVVGAW